MKGLLDFVNNLRAEDAIYHGDCNSRFQSEKTNKLKSLLKLYLGNVGGHQLMREREEAFEEIVKYLWQNDGEQLLSVN